MDVICEMSAVSTSSASLFLNSLPIGITEIILNFQSNSWAKIIIWAQIVAGFEHGNCK